MLLVEASRETKIGELDVAATVEKDVVRLDITGARVRLSDESLVKLKQSKAYRWMKPSL